jgi:hypothetical protein
VNRAPGPVPLVEGMPPPTLRRVYIPPQCFQTTNLDAALEWLFGPVPPAEGPFPPLNPRHALLSTLNKTVDEVNALVLERYVEGRPMVLEAAHEVCKDSAGNEDGISRLHATEDYMRGVTQSGVPNAKLTLKPGCVMLLTRNMLSTLGLVNGTRLVLLSEAPAAGTTHPVLHVETVPPPGLGLEPKRFFIPRITFELTTPGGLKFYRRQFPVRLAYAFTGQKAQGQTIVRSVSDSRHEAFAHGVSYVMQSRTTGFGTLGFLHAPLAEGEAGTPTFVNHVLQAALGPGVLCGEERPPAHARGAMEYDSGDGEGGEESSGEEGGGDGGGDGAAETEVVAPRRKRQRVVQDPNTLPATFQRGAMTLTERRTSTHAAVQHVFK